jgi:mRNA interferase HigB
MRTSVLRVISIKKLREFWTKYPKAESALRAWYTIAKAATWKHFPELKQSFPAADLVERRTVFDVSGNHFRLVARVNYKTQGVFVLYVLTHREYDANRWQERD